MSVPQSLINAVGRLSPLAGKAAKRFVNQPTLFKAASGLVAQALKRLDPPVLLQPWDVALGWPADDSAAGEDFYIALPELLIDLYVRDSVLTVVPGFQRAMQRQEGRWVPLGMDLRELAQELDALRPSLVYAFKQAVMEHWSETGEDGKTHWAWMGNYLHEAFVRALDIATQIKPLPPLVYLAAVTVAAQRDTRLIAHTKPVGRFSAYLIQLQRDGRALPYDARLDPHLLITLNGETTPEAYLTFSVNTGMRYFPSSQAMLASFKARISLDETFEGTLVQQVKVQGDVFEALARTLLQTQLIQVEGATDWISGLPDVLAGERLKLVTEAMTSFFELDANVQASAIQQLRQALPDWLQGAPAADRWHFAGALAKIALSQPSGALEWFLKGIPTLESYALTQLREQALKAHPEGPVLEPENIVASLETVVADPIVIAGGPSDTRFHEQPVSVVDLMIDNLAAHSAGWLKLKAKPGTVLPSWLDGDALKALVRQADVGRTYPALLREQLLEGSEAEHREALFGHEVLTQLPLLALQLLMSGESGLDHEGYRLVDVGLGGTPSSDSIRLMRLGVTAGTAYGTDSIAATFVFINQDRPGSACVLYRPLHEHPLRQYTSLDALWEELVAPGELQDETLRWMTDVGRTRYSHGGFREPRVVRFGSGSEFAPLTRPSAANLVLSSIETPLLGTLYRDIVVALIGQAERRSVSDSEDNWAALGQLVGALFNSVLPLVSGPVATAGWLIQLSDQFAAFLKANERPGETSIEARNDLLFTVIILLMSEAVHWPIDEPGVLEPGKGEEAEGPVPDTLTPSDPPLETIKPPAEKVILQPPVLAGRPVLEENAVHRPEDFSLAWSSATLQLEKQQQAALLALRAKPPLVKLSPISHGPARGLYLDGNRLLMFWHQHFYNIAVVDDGYRMLGAEGQPGPYVRLDEAERWTLDLRLRLRGGGPKNRVEARRRQNERIREQGSELFMELVREFDHVRDQGNSIAEQLEQAIATQQPIAPLREAFDVLLREGYEQCAQRVNEYHSLNERTPLVDFAERSCLLSSRLINLSKAITDNLSVLTSEFIESSHYADANGAELNALIKADPSSWDAFVDRFDMLIQHAINYVQAHQKTLRDIEQFPGLGKRTLEHIKDAVPVKHSVLDLYASLTYCHVSYILDSLYESPALAAQVEDALEPLMVHATSHAEVHDNLNLTVAETTQVLDTAIHHYQRVEDALQVLGQTLPEKYAGALSKLGTVTLALRTDAERHMGELVRASASEAVKPAAKPTKSTRAKPLGLRKPKSTRRQGDGVDRPRGEQPANQLPGEKEIIHTTEGETVLAQVQVDTQTGAKTATVSSGGRVVVTWRLDSETELWKKVLDTSARPKASAMTSLNLLVRTADRALAEAELDVQRIGRFKQTTCVPADIEDQYHGQAKRLEELAEQIERQMTASNVTDALTEEGSAELKARTLREQAGVLKSLGTQARIELSKSLMPTAARVRFLQEVGEVTIRRLGARTPLGRGGRRDYVQEYEIRDRQHVLWYAHFHYDTIDAPAQRYTAAHLKTVSQRFDGYQKQLQQARNDQEVVSIYRSRIEPPLANQLFLSLP